ncbi:MAG: hypothetical protein ACYCWW_01440 [Deltaproteobacteria bacterium]
MPTPQVGGEVDAQCTRCKMPLGHTILAMVGSRIARVRCNTCQGEHAYHSTGGESTPPRALKKKKPPTRPRAKAEAQAAADGGDLDTLLRGKDISRPRRYSPKDEFTKGDVLESSAFGLGIVLNIRGDRFDALFREGVKTLAQRKGQGLPIAKRLSEAPAAEGPGDEG